MDAWGVAADEGRPSTRRYALRETFSRVLALAMVLLRVEPAASVADAPSSSARR
jgi:SanA protein